MDESLLIRLGVLKDTDRAQLLECFEYSFKVFSNERVAVFSAFFGLIVKCVDDVDRGKTLLDEINQRNGELSETLVGCQACIENMKDTVLSVETRSSELAIVSSKQSEGIAAFKAKVESQKQRLKEAGAVIESLRNEVSDAKLRASIPCGSCPELRSEALESGKRLEALQKLHVNRQHSTGVFFFRKQAAAYRFSLMKVKRDWEAWSKHGASMDPRCGCKASIGFFERRGIDLAWVTAEANRASEGYQRELKQAVDDLKARVAVIRAECDEKVQSACRERDDAIADNAIYIDQMLDAKKEQTTLRSAMLASVNELSSIKAEFAKRQSFELSVRASIFRGSDGIEKHCPVSTTDGVLVSLADVYTGWLSGEGDGLETQFKCPISGKWVELRFDKQINNTFICRHDYVARSLRRRQSRSFGCVYSGGRLQSSVQGSVSVGGVRLG